MGGGSIHRHLPGRSRSERMVRNLHPDSGAGGRPTDRRARGHAVRRRGVVVVRRFGVLALGLRPVRGDPGRSSWSNEHRERLRQRAQVRQVVLEHVERDRPVYGQIVVDPRSMSPPGPPGPLLVSRTGRRLPRRRTRSTPLPSVRVTRQHRLPCSHCLSSPWTYGFGGSPLQERSSWSTSLDAAGKN